MEKEKENMDYDVETEQLKDLRDRIILNELEINGNQRLEELIQTLGNTQKEWQDAVSELKQKQTEYKNLISQFNKIKKMIIDDVMKSKISILTKLKIQILRYRKH